jgi:hypothetical protein
VLLPEAFQKSESLRAALLKARPVLDLAMHAIANEDEMLSLTDDANALANSNRHSEFVGKAKLKKRLREMMAVPPEEPSPMLEDHIGLDALDLIAARAEREAALTDPPSPAPQTKKKK